MTAVFFPLYGSWVTSDEASFLKRRPKIGIDLNKGPRDPMTDRTRLTGNPPALNIHVGIKTSSGLGHLERLEHDHSGRFAAKIVAEISVIDDKISLAGFESDPSHGSLPSPSRIECLFCHCFAPKLLSVAEAFVLRADDRLQGKPSTY